MVRQHNRLKPNATKNYVCWMLIHGLSDDALGCVNLSAPERLWGDSGRAAVHGRPYAVAEVSGIGRAVLRGTLRPARRPPNWEPHAEAGRVTGGHSD